MTSSLSREALVFATIFRREASRTGAVQASVAKMWTVVPGSVGPGCPVTTQQAAAHPGMNGYDIWAATAIEKFLDHDKLSLEQMIWIASALSRAPMCEVVWAEYYLSGGVIPWKGLGSNTYNEQSKRFRPFVRPWPMLTEKSRDTYFELMSKRSTGAKKSRHFDPRKSPIDPVGLLLVDDPWVLPKDVRNDPEYTKPIPPADLHGKTIEWDAPGLMKRVEHEWLVVAAAFDDRMDQELRGQDGTLSGPVAGGGTVGEGDGNESEWTAIPGVAVIMGLLGLGAGWLIGYPKTGGAIGAAGGAYLGYRMSENILDTNYIGPHKTEEDK